MYNMIQTAHTFRAVPRPKGVLSCYSLIVIDGDGRPHLPLTRFYYETQQALSDGAARTYLNTLLPYFTYLATDGWRQRRGDQWDSAPEAVRESARDYLVYRLQCKVRRHETHEAVSLTVQSPSTVRVFLAALKQFYSVMHRAGWYQHSHPLTDPANHLLQEIEMEEYAARSSRHRMPQMSGVEKPKPRCPSENYFRLVEADWIPQPIDDPKLPEHLRKSFQQARLCLRDQIVVRLAYETGARIREILRLTIGDWRARGSNQEAWAFSKGSRGRRIKVIRFDSETARMLREYINTERRHLDPQHRRLERLHDTDPLFLSARRKPYDYRAFIPNWKKLCKAAKIELNVHGLRHWHVTQAMRVIVKTSTSEREILLRKEELVRYMAWRSPKTLEAYEHYFQAHGYAKTHDQLLKRIYEQDAHFVHEQEGRALPEEAYHAPVSSDRNQDTTYPSTEQEENGWARLLALGSKTHA